MMRFVFRGSMVLSVVLALAACVSHARPGEPTTTTSAPAPPSHRTPASPAEAWSTSGGPASPGAPSTGTVVDPNIEPIHDGGVW